MSHSSKPKSALAALTGAALCLPAYAWTEPQTTTAYRFSHYGEDDLSARATNGQNGERYAIDSHQFQLLHPLNERYEASADLVFESMSGASPWFVVPDANNRSIQVMSGATIDDQRLALDLKTRRHREQGYEALSAGLSKEKDYLSLNTGIETRHDFNQRNSTFSAAASVSRDFLEPTDGASTRFPTRIDAADKTSASLLLALSHNFTPRTAAQLSFSYGYSQGYLSDPYKLVYVDSNLLQDARPGSRNTLATSLRLRHYLPALKAALQVDYRRFGDSWDIVSDTLEVGWHQTLPGGWKLIPTLRYYQQGAADFYRNYFVTPRADGHYSSDYRLSSYGAISGRLTVVKQWRDWQFSAAAERYDSSSRYALHKTNEANPGLVDFTVLSVAARWQFGGAAAAIADTSAQPAAGSDTPQPMQVVPVER